MHFVYILELTNGKYYIGQTNNLERRVLRHHTGQSRYTKAYRPLKLVYSEEMSDLKAARERESYLKRLKSHSALKKIIDSTGDPAVMAPSSSG